MSIAVLNDLYMEVRRLAIAGSVIAPGDFRLQKLIEPLRKSGEKAPVFAKVADGVEKLVASNEKTSASALLELSALVTSILYTQGATGIEGEWQELPSSPFQSLQTKTSARVLKPLIDALTSVGSGRLELITDAYERGLFNDLRLIRPTLQAMDDGYSEIAEFIVDKVLPLFGPAIASELRDSLDLKGKAGQGRRLLLLHKLAPAEAREFVMRALDEGSKEVKLAAIQCLDSSEKDLTFLLEQTRSRSQDIRGAAIAALVRSNHDLALKSLLPMLDGKDLPLLARSTTETVSDPLASEAAKKITPAVEELLAQNDQTKLRAIAERIIYMLEIIHPQRQKYSALMMEVLGRSDALLSIRAQVGGLDVIQKLVEELSQAGDAGVNYLIQNRDRLPPECFGRIATAARNRLSAREFFEIFAPYAKSKAKKNTDENVRCQQLLDTLIQRNRILHPITLPTRSARTPLDPAWFDLAIRNNLSEVVYGNAIPNNIDLHAYLIARWEDCIKRKDWHELYAVGCAMHDSEHPDFDKLIVHQLEATIGKGGMNHVAHRLIRLASLLPPSSIPALEAMIADSQKLAGYQRELLDCIDAIRERMATVASPTS